MKRSRKAVEYQNNMSFQSCLLVVAFATIASCHGQTCKYRLAELSKVATMNSLSFISQVNRAPDISLITARRYTTVAAKLQECTPLTQDVVDHFRCTAIWMGSGRSSRGEWMALLTSTATGPAMSMALVTLMVNTGWA